MAASITLSARLLAAWNAFAHQYPEIDWGWDTRRTRLADHNLNVALFTHLEGRLSDCDLQSIWKGWCESYLREFRLQKKQRHETERLAIPKL